ncbi:hypothetical protein Pyn_08822 [Prunus yedoensis var. nudiflora]|uniref:Uncharacterized protein n=1 Tax=Prunus yedoensis var. nudiflora TaxID=2094558 RepID=A0A314ZFB1_PRUYE|nr:hypothetical protein Pyn_08822 [Prunus yedoensis var. nudiflora]
MVEQHCTCSSPALGAGAAIIMDIVVDKGDLAQFRESGRIWWAQFRDIEDDTTSFYSLPEKVLVFLKSFSAVLNSFTAMVRDLRMYLGL